MTRNKPVQHKSLVGMILIAVSIMSCVAPPSAPAAPANPQTTEPASPEIAPTQSTTVIPTSVSQVVPIIYYEGSQKKSDGDISLSLEFTSTAAIKTGKAIPFESRTPLERDPIKQAKIAYARRVQCQKQLPVERSYVLQLIAVLVNDLNIGLVTPPVNWITLDDALRSHWKDSINEKSLAERCGSGAPEIDQSNRVERWENLIQFSIQMAIIARGEGDATGGGDILRSLRPTTQYENDYYVPNECNAKSVDLPTVIGRPNWWFVMSFKEHVNYESQYSNTYDQPFRETLHQRYTYLERLFSTDKAVKSDGESYPIGKPDIWACVVAYGGDEKNEDMYFESQPCWWRDNNVVKNARAEFDGKSYLECHVDLSYAISESGTGTYKSTALDLSDPKKTPVDYAHFEVFWIKAFGAPQKLTESTIGAMVHASLNNGRMQEASSQFGAEIKSTDPITWGINFEQVASAAPTFYEWWWLPGIQTNFYMPNPVRTLTSTTPSKVLFYPRGIFYIGFDPRTKTYGNNLTLDEIIVDPCAGNGGTKCAN